MKKLIVGGLVFLALNVAIVDVAIVKADRFLVRWRDKGCDAIYGDGTLHLVMDPHRSEFSVLSFRSRAGGDDVDLYGCDLNGHRYRMWRH